LESLAIAVASLSGSERMAKDWHKIPAPANRIIRFRQKNTPGRNRRSDGAEE
jgi:hypothetical protein